MATTHMPHGGGHPTYTRGPIEQGAMPAAPTRAQGYQAYGFQEPTPSRGVTLTGVTQLAGAAVSLALIVGIGVWGYKLIIRDISGIPIVKALEEPMRVAPENPGGTQAAHQGLAVNEVAGRGAAAGPVDQLVLAPTPVDLASEDAPQPQLQLTSTNSETTTQQPVASVPLSPEDAAIQALADQIAADTKPLSPLNDEVVAAVPEAVESPEAVETAQVAGPNARSLRPQVRPASLSTTALAAAPAVADTNQTDIDPADIPSGTRLVQLGAYDSADVARVEWTVFAARFGDFFNDKRRVIEEAQSGGRTFYRLRAEGFADLADARRFCAALVAEGTDCIPVVTR